jgi:hypothetical protein
MMSGASPGWMQHLKSKYTYNVGQLLFFLGLAGLVVAELVLQNMLPSLAAHDAPNYVGNIAALAIAAGIAAGLYPASQAWLRSLLPATFSVLFLVSIWSIIREPARADVWVGSVEAATIAATAAWLTGVLKRKHLLIVVGLMLVCFGVVHLVEHALIASLIPTWLPFPAIWPWLTGPLMIVAGLALLADRYSRRAGVLIGGMFLSWLPIVHLGRIAGSPSSAFEWSFALTAMVLAGVCLVAATAPEQHDSETV